MTRDDRTVHGLTADGDEIVRYDRAGQWWIEPGPNAAPDTRRRHVSVTDAAKAAKDGTHFPGLPGGSMYDAITTGRR